MIVGLTGGIGSGKSEAARIFAGLGVPVVDVDTISHQLTVAGQPALKQIAAAFGSGMLTEDGNLDRGKLRQLVFSDTDARHRLEAILHPAIHEAAIAALKNSKERAPYQVLAIPLLFENQRYLNLIQRSLVIDCDESLQISRTMARSHLTEKDVRRIMAAQISRHDRLRLADDVIVNAGSLEELQENVAKIHEKYINTCRVSN